MSCPVLDTMDIAYYEHTHVQANTHIQNFKNISLIFKQVTYICLWGICYGYMYTYQEIILCFQKM